MKYPTQRRWRTSRAESLLIGRPDADHNLPAPTDDDYEVLPLEHLSLLRFAAD